MSIPPGKEIGKERHRKNTQFFRVEGVQGIIEFDDGLKMEISL
jgi:hypothetical protein